MIRCLDCKGKFSSCVQSMEISDKIILVDIGAKIVTTILSNNNVNNNKFNNGIYYININEIPGELSRENLIFSLVKITCYLHM